MLQPLAVISFNQRLVNISRLCRKNFIASTRISEVIEELIEWLNNNEPPVEDNSKLNEISISVYLANINDNTILYLYIGTLLQVYDTEEEREWLL